MKVRTSNEFSNKDLRTVNQWAKVYKTPINGDMGINLWTNGHCCKSMKYYSVEEVRDMTEEEIENTKNEKRLERKEKAEQKKIRVKKSAERQAEQIRSETEYQTRISLGKTIGSDLIRRASENFNVDDLDPIDLIVFDTETTGVDSSNNEIIQISIIDGLGNILLNSYVKPYWSNNWDEAAKIHHITPEMVADAPYPHELVSKVLTIFESAKTLVAYNGEFDLRFLEAWGVKPNKNQKIVDVMKMFAPIYGEWNEYFGNYKWQPLTKCASHYGYEFKAHDSLEDVRATLYCYNKIISKRVINEN